MQNFLYSVNMLDLDFRQKFLPKRFNPQLGILTKSQKNILAKLNFHNFLNQQMLTPSAKNNISLKNQTTSPNLS